VPDPQDLRLWLEIERVQDGSTADMLGGVRRLVAYSPELFDLGADPEEATNLAGEPAYPDTLRDMYAELRKICDPAEVDRQAPWGNERANARSAIGDPASNSERRAVQINQRKTSKGERPCLERI
jgi:hypothetical protein